ncbi:MAG: ATP-binding protein [Pseudomonadales bacterium]|nr:ATP-binding protein [Pseudomonadales bacterium]
MPLTLSYGAENRVLELSGQTMDHMSLGPYLSVLEDPSGQLSFDQIHDPVNDSMFQIFPGDVPSYGYTKSSYWVRLKIANKSDVHYQWVLEVPYAPLDSITLFYQTPSGYEKKMAGDSLPFSVRDISYPSPAFFVETRNQTEQWIYLRVVSTSSLQVPVVWWSHKHFVSTASTTLLFWGLYFGALLIAAGYNTFLFLSLKDNVYGYYVAFVLLVMTFQLTVNGFASQYLWPEYAKITNHVLLVSLNLMGIMGGVFSVVFLRLRSMIPLAYWVLAIIMSLMALNILLVVFVPYRIVLKATITLFALGAVTLILTGGLSWYRGYKPARIYFFAWMAMLAGAITFSLKTLGLIPSTSFTAHAVTIGSAVEVFLLSLAIGDRVNVDRIEKKRAQNKLLDTQRELLGAKQSALENAELSDRKKQEFLATMSHELRTPLNGILGCTQLLKEAPLAKEEANVVSYLSTSAKQMLSHVNRILNFSQLHEGILKLESVVFEMSTISTALKQAYAVQCVEKDLSFEVNLGSEVSGYYLGDKQKLLMIISDLVENAIKFTSKGYIRVSIEDRGHSKESPKNMPIHWLAIRIEDTGCGIDTEDKEHIFKMFSQQDSSFKREHEGLGLGLAICQKYVELLGGDISFESQVGKGTLFELNVPLQKPSNQPLDVASESSQQNVVSNQRILVVEDNPTNQMILEKMLHKLGFQSEVAANGVEALDWLQKAEFQLILMDCHMPIMDGFEATTHIRNGDPNISQIPIVAVTANALAGDRERCLDAGMNDYIAKPFSKELLSGKVRFWLANSPQSITI